MRSEHKPRSPETIVDRGGDYLLPVKENQGQLYEDLERLFSIEEREGFITPGYTYARKVDDNHGRLEIRECWATSSAECLDYLRGRDNWKAVEYPGDDPLRTAHG